MPWPSTTLVGLILCTAGVTQPPPLPDLAVDRFPAASRAALEPLVDRARRAPNDEASIGQLAMMLHAWEQWDAAHAAYLRARALAASTVVGAAPRDSRADAPRAEVGEGSKRSGAFRWAYLDAIVLQRLGRPNEAAQALREALAIPAAARAAASGGGEGGDARSVDVAARVKLAEALFESGRIAESAALYRELVKEPAAEPIAELGLGRIAAGDGRHADAIPHLTRAIALFPEFGAAHYALARALRALGKTDAAQRAIERHQQFGARWPALADPLLAEVTALRDDARASMQRGVKLAAAGDVAGAIAAHEAALARVKACEGSHARECEGVRGSSLAQAHVELIALYGREKNWAKAEEHYRAAVAIGTELEVAHYNYGVLLGLQGRWTEAAAAYTRALEVNPLNPQALNNLGQVLEQDRKLEEAAAVYRRAVDGTPGFRLARFNLGRMLIALGRPQQAIAQLERLTEPRDGEAPRYLFALAVAHIHAGQKDAGIKWATEARRLALEHGQQELAAAIDRDLSTLR